MSSAGAPVDALAATRGRSWLKRLANRYLVLSLFWCSVILIVIVWWPLAQEQLALIDWSRPLLGQLDWLLLGIFAAMSVLILVTGVQLPGARPVGVVTERLHALLREVRLRDARVLGRHADDA